MPVDEGKISGGRHGVARHRPDFAVKLCRKLECPDDVPVASCHVSELDGRPRQNRAARQ